MSAKEAISPKTWAGFVLWALLYSMLTVMFSHMGSGGPSFKIVLFMLLRHVAVSVVLLLLISVGGVPVKGGDDEWVNSAKLDTMLPQKEDVRSSGA